MNCKIEIKQDSLSFDVEDAIAPLLGYRKILNKANIYTSQKFFVVGGFNTFYTFTVVLYLVLKIMLIQTYYEFLI